MSFAPALITAEAMRLNAICPYFTMFPLGFPLDVLEEHAKPNGCVLDPFCGRGTTNFAARLAGLDTIGIDVSPVATAATRSRLVALPPEEIVDETKAILNRGKRGIEVPEGKFWRLAYHEDVLQDLCQIRTALMERAVKEPIAAALRGIILGALHGPVGRTKRSYFSNQCPRTYGPKPAYAVKFWTERKLAPPLVDVVGIIAERAQRYYGTLRRRVGGTVVEGDSRDSRTVYQACKSAKPVTLVITSPPYYGLTTYLPDQWIRNWFLGGPSTVEYSARGQVSHKGRDRFIADLRRVWVNIGQYCKPGAKLVVRFGSIGDRIVNDPAQLVMTSLDGTGWSGTGVRHADTAARGKRQADTFRRKLGAPRDEVDVWARWLP